MKKAIIVVLFLTLLGVVAANSLELLSEEQYQVRTAEIGRQIKYDLVDYDYVRSNELPFRDYLVYVHYQSGGVLVVRISFIDTPEDPPRAYVYRYVTPGFPTYVLPELKTQEIVDLFAFGCDNLPIRSDVYAVVN